MAPSPSLFALGPTVADSNSDSMPTCLPASHEGTGAAKTKGKLNENLQPSNGSQALVQALPQVMQERMSQGERIDMERKALKMEIEELIEPYRQRDERPPFSTAELVVMAVIYYEDPSSKEAILAWIMSSFVYYTVRAISEYVAVAAKSPTNPQRYGRPPHDVFAHEEFHHAFNSYEVPLRRMIDSDAGGQAKGQAYDVPTHAGRIFLRHYFEPERKGAFPFLRLPAELRNDIYDMVFAFPKAGFGMVTIIKSDGVPAIRLTLKRLIEEDDDQAENIVFWGQYREHIYPCRVSEALTLLLTCKQIYNEAMPNFYRDNHFYFASVDVLGTTMCSLSASRIEHFSDLHLNLATIDYYSKLTNFVPAMKALCTVKNLKKLCIEVNDGNWIDMHKDGRKHLGRITPFRKPAQIPGFAELAQVAANADVLEVRSTYAFDKEIEKWIIKTANSLKTAKSAAPTIKKRLRKPKAVVQSDEQAESSEMKEDGPSKKTKKSAKGGTKT